jgi:hypothetical protein
MIMCLRTVDVPPAVRESYLAWIAEGRAVREAHGILAELVCEPSSPAGDTVAVTIWPDPPPSMPGSPPPNATPSPPRQSTRPSTTTRSPRYQVVAGHLNRPALTTAMIPGEEHP